MLAKERREQGKKHHCPKRAFGGLGFCIGDGNELCFVLARKVEGDSKGDTADEWQRRVHRHSCEAEQSDSDSADHNDTSGIDNGNCAPVTALAAASGSLAPREPLVQEADGWLLAGRARIHAMANV